MLALIQALCLIILVVGCVAWFSWVKETARVAKAPEHLNQIFVHGAEEKSAQDLARAISVGFIGEVAEHKRAVAMINDAASRPGRSRDIRALQRISTPTPALLQAPKVPGNVDIKLEYAGAKLETQGLQKLLLGHQESKGALSISLLLNPAEGNSYKGTASASFPEDGDYGFSLPVDGQAENIARQLALRYIQSHYAKADRFYAVLSAEDFRTFWKARIAAAEIALKQESGADAPQRDDPAAPEAREVLKTIDHLVKRYRAKSEFQKLGAYLARVAGDLVRAREHLDDVKKLAAAEEKAALEVLIALLDKDIAQEISAARAKVASAASREPSPVAPLIGQKALQGTGIAQSAAKARASGREVKVAILLGPVDDFPQFQGRIVSAVGNASSGSHLKEHTNGLVGLLAELAPTAMIRVFPVLGDAKAAVSPLDVTTAMESAVMEGAQVLLVPLGFPGGPDMTIRAVVKFAIARGIFVVWPAGNEGKAIERRHADQGAVYVGAVENDNRAVYSNYGTGVTLYAPGSVLTYTTPTAYGELTGTSYSATIVAAAAANLIAASATPPSPVDLEAQLVRQTRERAGMRILSLSAP